MDGRPSGHRVVFWDFDGTLGYRVDRWAGALLQALDRSEPGHTARLANLRSGLHNGFPWHTPDIAHPHLRDPDAWWNHLVPVFDRAYRMAGVLPDVAARTATDVRAAYLDLAAWTVFEDARPALELLRALGWRHVVISNHVPELPELVGDLGLGDLVDRVVNSAATGYEKPNPLMFAMALELSGRPDQKWMVGDNPVADVAGAEAAGIPAVLVRSPDQSGVTLDLLGAAHRIAGH